MAGAASRILVIEDHPALGRLISAGLAGAGWVVLGPVADRDDALDAARRLPCELALMDRWLRGEESFAIADALLARGVPVLLMSGYPRATLPERFRAFPFLEKPFTTQALLGAVRGALGGGEYINRHPRPRAAGPCGPSRA